MPIKRWALCVLTCALLAPAFGVTAHATPDPSVTAGPLLNGSVYHDDPVLGSCFESNAHALVVFVAELSTGAGYVQVTSKCGHFYTVFQPGECAVRKPPLEGIRCSFTASDGSRGAVGTASRTIGERGVGGYSDSVSGNDWSFGGYVLGAN